MQKQKGKRKMKVYNERYIIQSNESPILFHANKGETVEEINEAAFYVDKTKAEEDLSMYDKSDQAFHVAKCMITYNF